MPSAEISRGDTGRVTTDIVADVPAVTGEITRVDTGRVTTEITAYDASDP